MHEADDFLSILRREPVDLPYPEGPQQPREAHVSPLDDGLMVKNSRDEWSFVCCGDRLSHLSLPKIAAQATSVTFSGDGRFLILLGAAGETIVKILDGPDRDAIILPTSDTIYTTACTFLGTTAQMVCGFSDGVVSAYDGLCIGPSDEPETKILYRHSSAVSLVRSAPDGSFLLTADSAGQIVIFDGDLEVSSRRLMNLHKYPLVACAFSPSGDYVATADESGAIFLTHLRMDTGKAWSQTGVADRRALTAVDVPSWPGEKVAALTFSPLGNWLAVTFYKTGVLLHRIDDDRAEGPLDPHFTGFSAPLTGPTAFSADDCFLLCLGDGCGGVVETSNANQAAVAPVPRAVAALAASEDGSRLWLGFDHGVWMPFSMATLFAMGAAARGLP